MSKVLPTLRQSTAFSAPKSVSSPIMVCFAFGEAHFNCKLFNLRVLSLFWHVYFFLAIKVKPTSSLMIFWNINSSVHHHHMKTFGCFHTVDRGVLNEECWMHWIFLAHIFESFWSAPWQQVGILGSPPAKSWIVTTDTSSCWWWVRPHTTSFSSLNAEHIYQPRPSWQ